MKKWAILILIAVAAFLAYRFFHPEVTRTPTGKASSFASQGTQQKEQSSIFVPYWTLDGEAIQGKYDTYIYFGLGVDEKGIDASDPGYAKLHSFVQSAYGKRKILAVVMTDSSLNSEILRNKKVQNEIIKRSVSIAKKNGFDGVILDLESSSIAFESVIARINNFSDSFYAAAKAENLEYDVALFGDTYFRSRPYNVADIAKHSDRIYVMAYDFSKSHGNPGPNFPLDGKDKYGYDFKTMISDFKKDVRPDKLVVVFGMFGYDWPVDSNGEADGFGTSTSYNLAKQNLISSCNYNSCTYRREESSKELHVSYKDSGTLHTVWFEDPVSVHDKQEFLKKEGIYSYSYWAYSFF